MDVPVGAEVVMVRLGLEVDEGPIDDPGSDVELV